MGDIVPVCVTGVILGGARVTGREAEGVLAKYSAQGGTDKAMFKAMFPPAEKPEIARWAGSSMTCVMRRKCGDKSTLR